MTAKRNKNSPSVLNVQIRIRYNLKLKRIYFYFCVVIISGVHRGGIIGARAPAPLRSDAKVPLPSGLCDMNNGCVDMCRAPSPRGGTIPVAPKKKKFTSCLGLNTDDHIRWTTMSVKIHKHSGLREEKTKRWKRSPHVTFRWLHSESKKY